MHALGLALRRPRLGALISCARTPVLDAGSPVVPLLARGLAWKRYGYRTIEDLRTPHTGWRAERQKVPPRVRIPESSWKLFVGDEVVMREGKDEGKRGRIIEVRPDENRVVVDGINVQKQHRRGDGENAGGILDVPGPVHYSNVALINPMNDKPTRVRYKLDATGKRVRVTPDGVVVPYPKKPPLVRPTEEDGPCDTAPADVHQVTYEHYDEFMSKYSFT